PVDGNGNIDMRQYDIVYTRDTFQAICDFIWYESPELFRIDSIACKTTLNNVIVSINPEYNYENPADFVSAYNLMVQNGTKLLSGIEGNSSLTDVEKALLIHDRIAVFCEYDIENLENDTLPNEAYNAYGVLGKRIAVCMGYALAYDYLLERVGIKSDYCSSDVLCHAWNVVYIDNKPYHVDITWDDPVEDVTGSVYHDNFLRSTQGIKDTGHVGETLFNSNVIDYITTPVDTTYDNYFWQESSTEFQLIGDKIYYMDNNLSKEGIGMRVGKLIEMDGFDDDSTTVLKEIREYWCEDAAQTSRWPENYSKLASGRGLLFYSTPYSVYSYNPLTEETNEILSKQDIYNETENENLSVFGMTFNGCLLAGEYSTTPYYERDTKSNNYFVRAVHNPQENWKIITQPSAYSEGIEGDFCIDCGAEKERRPIPPTGEHNWGEWYVDPNRPATCTESGVRLMNCLDEGCDAQLWEQIEPLGHDYQDSWTTDVEATCITAGEKSHHCTRCSSRIDITILPATEVHIKSGAWITGKEPSCREAGFKYRVCVGCGIEMERVTLAKLSHQVILQNERKVTCTVNGYTGDQVCSVCGTVIKLGTAVTAQGHKSSEWIIDNSPTPSSDGAKHKECTVCGEVLASQTIKYVASLSTPAVNAVNTADGIKLSWKEIPNVESYTVYRRVYNKKTKKYSGWSVVAGGYTKTTYIDSDVKLGTIYSYAVRAVSGTVKSSFKATKGLTYNYTPSLKVANATSGAKVTWSKVQNATGYTVYSSTYNTKTKKWSSWKNRGTASASATSWVDKSVKNATYYRYTVRAVYGSTKSSYNKTGVKVYFITSPAAKIANTASGVKVSWNKISGAKNYVVYRSELSGGKWSGWKTIKTVKSSVLALVDSTAKSGVNYRYAVRAINGSHKSSYKVSNSLVYLAQPVVTVANDANGIRVSWNKINGATGYTVYSSYYNPTTKKWSGWSNRGTADGARFSWVDKKVKSGTYYRYTVKAVNGKTTSTYKSSGKILCLAQPVFNAERNNNGVYISWAKIAGAKGYKIYRKALGSSKWVNIGSTTATYYTDAKVNYETDCIYTVRAYNGSFVSSYDKNGVTVDLDYKKIMLELINKERKSNGVHELEYYYDGQILADTRADELVEEFSHTRPDGSEWHTIFNDYEVSYNVIGENIASGYTTPESVMKDWMGSYGHRSNILDSEYDYVIVGYNAAGNCWVQLFLG
ncbi:MAG: hypothetical protein IKC01_02100, partial [Clostridia bacterium]|nr:hypothetical protein [Clostridia bacterium]